MKASLLMLMALPLAAAADGNAATDEATQALAAIGELGAINGRALACRASDVAARAKALMLEHSPRTAAYGNAFHEATSSAFTQQTRRPPEECPDSAALTRQLEALAVRLNDLLPTDAGARK